MSGRENMNTITLSEAKQQGYTHFFYIGDGFQSMKELEQATENDVNRGIELVSKDSYQPSSMDAKSLRDMIAEDIECNHSDESGDDTGAVYDSINKMELTPFEELLKHIDAELKKLNYYKGSGIKITN